jgi:dihydroxyacetone kinase-like protein
MLTTEGTKQWLLIFAEKVKANAAYLSKLDKEIGDGDHGSNMARGVEAMEEKLKESDLTSTADVFKTAAMSLLSKIGGASGPLYGSALIDMAKQAKENDNDVAAIVQAGLDGIQKRGKAEAGEKTLVDVWVFAVEAINSQSLSKASIQETVEQTKSLKATKGRAAYYGDNSIGHIDPGAASSGYFFEALIESGVLDG